MVETSVAGAKPDIAAIMKEIRQGIRERREAGFFTHEDVEEDTLARLRNYALTRLSIRGFSSDSSPRDIPGTSPPTTSSAAFVRGLGVR